MRSDISEITRTLGTSIHPFEPRQTVSAVAAIAC